MQPLQYKLLDDLETTNPHQLAALYHRAHDAMRNIDGLQPQEAFEELLKVLFFKQVNEELGPKLLSVRESTPLTKKEGRDLVLAIRSTFSTYVENLNSWFKDLWQDKKFHLSDSALLALWQMFSHLKLSQIAFDLRSAALKEFLSPEIRRGLGIYLTPDDVVKMMVEFVAPTHKQSVYDPACGSGTFLIETLKYRQPSKNGAENMVWGTDKNPRMLLLSDLNLGHLAGITFHRRVTDALFPQLDEEHLWPCPDSFDIIFTNPPFGVALDNTLFDLRSFQTCRTREGFLTQRQQSEIVFIEQALNYLKPGGILGIVLPKSVVTNSTFDYARQAIDKQGYVYAAVLLPPETFATTGTQASAVVLFIRKFQPKENRQEKIQIALAHVTNVGYDATGRARKDNQLLTLAAELQTAVKTKRDAGVCRSLPAVAKDTTCSTLGKLLSQKTHKGATIKLGDILEVARNGRTSPRLSYTESGLFVVKVGNLTGNGINWIARDRNFVSPTETPRRHDLMLRKGDILLTSAAHSPIYIAKKVDIVDRVPQWVGGIASLTGEVMLLRANPARIDPFVLLAYLRMPTTTQQLQMLIRGQTAHLYPNDVLNLLIPEAALAPDSRLKQAADILRRETELATRLNEYAFEQQTILSSISL